MINIANADKYFTVKDNKVFALNNISLNIEAAKIVGIIGHSGAGKSTLLRLMNGLEKADAGQVEVLGQSIQDASSTQLRDLRKQISMIFQHFNLLKTKTVFDNIAFPLRLDGQLNKKQIQERVEALGAQVGLTAHLQKYPKQLSGGQKQRVGIARALANSPKILLCDEATSALDPITTHEILNLLLQINRDLGITVVLITHEIDVIRRICDDVVVLEKGQIAEQGAVDQVLLHPVHPISRSLILEQTDIDEQHLLPQSTLMRVTAIGELAQRPAYEMLAQKIQVNYQILHSKVERTKTSLYSQSILALQGQGMQCFIQQLEQLGAHVEVIQDSAHQITEAA
ncbi:ATP-binding cassette domain-containing protein [Acinetobacter sp. ANC 5380]|uniref:Cell division ATP-binding protein FtsE n=1 Tax=Acinetobacter terrae TaxID=2731247 RepID=A0A7Y2RD20_9GAMM|nr:ATP-binding cassette domain-containing protein [Acinetobacter terrae]NNH76433.1 ATP-binding cassette domain-containing protein [Acinetobacter terrae]